MPIHRDRASLLSIGAIGHDNTTGRTGADGLADAGQLAHPALPIPHTPSLSPILPAHPCPSRAIPLTYPAPPRLMRVFSLVLFTCN